MVMYRKRRALELGAVLRLALTAGGHAAAGSSRARSLSDQSQSHWFVCAFEGEGYIEHTARHAASEAKLPVPGGEVRHTARAAGTRRGSETVGEGR